MKKMLIIEDDKIVGHIYRHRFQMEGFQVELASDGEAGLTAVKQFKPDMVILDLMLPRLSGVEVLRKLRADETTKSLPVIVLSNAYLSSIVQDAWKAGANHCMIKASCTPKQLIEVVNRLSADAAPLRDAPAASAPDPLPPSEDDGAFQSELRQTFLNSAHEQIA